MAMWSAFVFDRLRTTGDLVSARRRLHFGDGCAPWPSRRRCPRPADGRGAGPRPAPGGVPPAAGGTRPRSGGGVGRRHHRAAGAGRPALRHRPPGSVPAALPERAGAVRVARVLPGPALVRGLGGAPRGRALGVRPLHPARAGHAAPRPRASGAPSCSASIPTGWLPSPGCWPRWSAPGGDARGADGRSRARDLDPLRGARASPAPSSGRLSSVGVACAAGLALGAVQSEITILSSRRPGGPTGRRSAWRRPCRSLVIVVALFLRRRAPPGARVAGGRTRCRRCAVAAAAPAGRSPSRRGRRRRDRAHRAAATGSA